MKRPLLKWAGTDSNRRSRKATDLQSARFNHLPTYPGQCLREEGVVCRRCRSSLDCDAKLCLSFVTAKRNRPF